MMTSKKDRRPKAVAYLYTNRMSEPDRSMAIELQLECIQWFCHEHNIDLVGEYAECGYDRVRPEFKKMIADVEGDSEFSMVIAYDRSRLSRDMTRHLKRLEKLEDAGLAYLFVCEEKSFFTRMAEFNYRMRMEEIKEDAENREYVDDEAGFPFDD